MSNWGDTILNSCHKFMQARLAQPCLLCGARCRGALLCAGCAADLPRLPTELCPRCALPSAGGAVCGHCLRHPPAFDRGVAVYAYAFPVDALVQHCKYAGHLALTDLFAAALAERLAGCADLPDALIPMPLHPARLSERGFNQATEIARRLAQPLRIEWLPAACDRTRDTPPQAGLDLKARHRNLRGAFACSVDLSGRRVALIDDVMTSGASLDALAQAVKRAGAAEVQAWVLARTL